MIHFCLKNVLPMTQAGPPIAFGVKRSKVNAELEMFEFVAAEVHVFVPL